MKSSERGPYARIRWYCADGSILPPTPHACREHGGGRQHAEYSDARRRLAGLGWPVGTILAATSWEELWDSGPRQRRLRELPLERYLIEVDDGWVLRRARYYRGYVQIEDEERAGRELLLAMLAEPDWVREHFLLARELVRALPHAGSGDRTRAVRRSSQEIAEKERSFEPIRATIHTRPGASDAASVREWIAAARARGSSPEVLEAAERLAGDLEEIYGPTGREARLESLSRAVARGTHHAEIGRLFDGLSSVPTGERISRLGTALRRLREVLPEASDARTRLKLLDLSVEAESELLVAGVQVVDASSKTPRELVSVALSLLDGAYGSGLLSAREREALSVPLAVLREGETVSTETYLEATSVLRRAGGWAAGSVRHTFGEALVSFGALEPKSWRFTDELLRSSPLLPLAEISRLLSIDAEARSGLIHQLFGKQFTAMLGLNPGVASGPLRIVRPDDLREGVRLAKHEIVVLPETVSELDPVAGILTFSSGNLLSHVQLLARNLGIPNATLPPRLMQEVEAHDGETVLLAVGTRGSVFLDRLDRVTPEALAILGPRDGSRPAVELIEAPRPDLSVRRPIPLEELHAGLSGKVVGPKAANLGELARKFPGRVAPAIALPFGVFAEHVTRGSEAPKAALDRAYARFRHGEIDKDALDAEVERVRSSIAALQLSADLKDQLVPLMQHHFGAAGTYGVFIRSDTNVEDLPGFTGAGLNETLPNVVGLDPLLAGVPRVWSSPFRQRAMAWRSSLLASPEEVYTSVLIMKSVPADKSGVLVTTDLSRRAPGLTVAMAWGVGGAVDGEAAETLAVREDGTVVLLSAAKAPYCRRLAESGGVTWVPAPSGAVLDQEELRAVEDLAAEVRARLEPVAGPDGEPLPWDVEFGFVEGRVTLFQVRPLVERSQTLADRMIAGLLPADEKRSSTTALDGEIREPDTPGLALQRE